MSDLWPPPLGLYIHIPWCQRKCPYCDFNSHESRDILPEADYIDALLRDLEQDLAYVQGRPLQSIFIGGGTPSLLSGDALRHLLEGITHRVAIEADAEITLEANPGSAEADKFADFVSAGVNRISLGIQSFDNQRLQALGRVHNSDQALAAIEMAQSVGLRSFNIDLMHGLPGQSRESARADLATAIDRGPPHLSWYQLTIEPNTEYYRRPPQLPGESILGDIQDQGEALLAREGFENYEISAYARQGHACKHNLNYWQFGDYLGIGAGAHSKVTLVAEAQVKRFAKRRQPEEYLSADPAALRVQSRSLSETDLIGEFMLNALRLDKGFDLQTFTRHTGLPVAVLDERLTSLQERGLLKFFEGRVLASARGRRFLDSVIAEFF
jgi:putative oxygen-independent coproporphyrinogen III oxidase